MTVDSKTVHAWDEEHARLSISSTRAAELAAELTQLQAAAQAARRRVSFDVDPYDFRAAQLECASAKR